MERESVCNRATHSGGTRGAADTNVVCRGLLSQCMTGASIPPAQLSVDSFA